MAEPAGLGLSAGGGNEVGCASPATQDKKTQASKVPAPKPKVHEDPSDKELDAALAEHAEILGRPATGHERARSEERVRATGTLKGDALTTSDKDMSPIPQHIPI